MPAFVPINLTFDGDSSLAQLLPPRVEVLRLCRESNVPDARSPVRRNSSVRCGTLARVKDQQDPAVAPENDNQIAPPDYFQAKRLVIKPLRSS